MRPEIEVEDIAHRRREESANKGEQEAKKKYFLAQRAKQSVPVVICGKTEIARLEPESHDDEENSNPTVDVAESSVDSLTDYADIKRHHEPANQAAKDGTEAIDYSVRGQCF